MKLLERYKWVVLAAVLLLLAAGSTAMHFYWQSPRGRIVALHKKYISVLTRMQQRAEEGNGIELGQSRNVWFLPGYPMNTRIPEGMSIEDFEELTTAVFISFMDNNPDDAPVFLSYSKPDIHDYDSYICPDREVIDKLRELGYPADYGRNGSRPEGEVGFGYWGTELCVLAIDRSEDGNIAVALSSEGGCVGSTEIAYVDTDEAGEIRSIVWHSQLVDDVLEGLDDQSRYRALGVGY